MDVLVTTGLYDSGETLFSDTHEGMGVGRRLHSIDSHTDVTVSSILEADWEGDTRGKLTMELRLGSTSADGTPRDYWMGDELSCLLMENEAYSRR